MEQALQATTDPVQKEVLLFLRDGGCGALRDLAKQTKSSPEALLVDVLSRGTSSSSNKNQKKHKRRGQWEDLPHEILCGHVTKQASVHFQAVAFIGGIDLALGRFELPISPKDVSC